AGASTRTSADIALRHQPNTVSAVVATSTAASATLIARDQAGCCKARDSAAPTSSQPRWITTIMPVSTAIFVIASRPGSSGITMVPANTAAMATNALGL